MTKYCAYSKLVKDLQWSLNQNVLPDIQDCLIGSPFSTLNNDQITSNMSDPTTKSQSSHARIDNL